MTLEIDDNLAWQRRVWAFERGGWVLLLLILVSAALGLFGDGVLASARVASAYGGVTLEFPRYLRARSPEHLIASAAPAQRGADAVVLWLDAAYLENVTIERIVPEPTRVRAGADRLTFEFASDGAGPLRIAFEINVRSGGRLHGRIGAGEESVEFSQLVYP